jgi:ribonuclease BN (tRNA processing enzyme)
MKLTILGGSAAGPAAGQGCSGFLLQDDETAIVIDLGPGTLHELKRHIDVRTVDALVLSHPHLDHTLDIGALRYSLMYAPSKLDRPLPLYLPPGADETLYYLGRAFSTESEAASFYDGVLDLRSYDPRAPLTVGSFTITFAPGVHYIPCWSMRITSRVSSRILGFTADSGPAARLQNHLTGVHTLLAEAAFAEPGAEPYESRGHSTAREAGELATGCGVEQLVLTHIWQEIGGEAQKQRASATYSGPISVATPGLKINV